MILAGLRSLDSVSGSSYYGQLMEKIQAGSSEFITGRDSILIDLSSWYRDSLAPKIETIQDAQDFSSRLVACKDNPLKVLTDDCHYHTVAAPSEKLLDLIQKELEAKGYLL